MALLPFAACTKAVDLDEKPLSPQPGQSPAGWSPDGKALNLQKVRIKKVKAILTAPYGIELVIVKVETDQPGLYGIGCDTFRQRAHTVASAVDAYPNASARTPEACMEKVAKFREQGYRHIRIQLGGYGATHLSENPPYKYHGFGHPDDNTMDAQAYKRGVIELFRLARKKFGDEVEFLHDMHEWVEPMSQRLYDFIRIHLSQIGGITPALKVTRLGEWFNVRTAWHGPKDTSPVGHAANAHIDLAIWNFGIQEGKTWDDLTHEISPS